MNAEARGIAKLAGLMHQSEGEDWSVNDHV
jgi:hypothetical protein